MAPSVGQLTQDVNNLQGFSGIVRSQNVSSPFFGGMSQPKGSALDQFFGKIGSVFSEGAHMFESAGEWLGRQAVTAAEAPIKLGESLALAPARIASMNYSTHMLDMQTKMLNQQSDSLTQMYHSGQISKDEYITRMNGLDPQFQSVIKQENDIAQKGQSYKDETAQSAIGTISDILMLTGGGLAAKAGLIAKSGGAELAAALTGKVGDEALSPVESMIARFAANKAEFGTLSDATKNALKASVTDVFMNTAKGATAQQIARQTAVNVLLKYPITFNYMNSTGTSIYHDMATGKYGDAVKSIGFNALLLLSGGPIGQALKYGGKTLAGIVTKTFGKSSFIDELSKLIGDGNPNGIYQAIKDNPDTIKAFQALEATNMAAENGKAVAAAFRVVNGLKASGWDLSQSSHQEFVDNVMGWHQAQGILHDFLTKSGMSEKDAGQFVVGRWTAPQANELAGLLTKGDFEGISQTPADRLKIWNDYKLAHPNSAVANNVNLDRQITKIITETPDASELDMKIRQIKAQFAATVPGLHKKTAEAIGKLGYVPIIPSKLEAPFIQGSQKLVTNAGESSEFFEKAVQPLPVLKTVGALLTSLGMSPERSEQSTYGLFSANLADNLQKTSAMENILGENAEDQAHSIMRKITNYVNDINSKKFLLSHPPVSDMRQLTRKEISEATGLTISQSKEVADAINQSMLDISLAERGLGAKMLDYVQSVNRGGRISMNGYLRAQGAGRFAWNPFFKMKLATKTEILSSMEGRGFISSQFDRALGLIFHGSNYDLNGTAQLLDSKGYFGGIGYSGQAADEAVASARDVKGTALRSQKLSIAGLISSQAEKQGMTVDAFVDNFPNETRDTIQSILHYNPNASFLNSPLARTLNFAFFPFRFDIKVASYAARLLQRQDAITQVAVIHGFMQAHNFLTSRQGMIWYSQNSDVLGLINYFTPLQELSTIAKFGDISHESIGSFGELGGLPGGFITQILQAEGMLQNVNGAYLNPKTGQPSVNYIPITARMKLASALTSFMGTLFSYPGSTAGLPSKTGFLSGVAEGLTGAGTSTKGDIKVPQTDLTPEQRQYQAAVQSLPQNQQNQSSPDATPTQPAVVAPPTENGSAAPVYTPSEERSRSKVKKSQEPLTPLPGQSKVGQIL